jgi:hypothetical protein
MAYIIAVLMAGLSFVLNRLLLRYLGKVTIISAGPVVEESAKTLFAYYLGADIFTVHMVFGVIEAGYDWYWRNNNKLVAPVLSIMGHSLFGAVTAGIVFLAGNLWLGLAAGIIMHVSYNLAVVRLLANSTVDKP